MRTGLEVFLAEGLPDLAGSRVGLITNQTGIDGRLCSGVDLLHRGEHVRLAAVVATCCIRPRF